MNNISFSYHNPNSQMRVCGTFDIRAYHLVGDEKSLNELNQSVVNLVKELDNLVSATDFSKCPINEGEWESLNWQIYLAGNSWKDGEYNVRTMSAQNVFDKAKKIIEECKEAHFANFK